jgi:hypothetical protein
MVTGSDPSTNSFVRVWGCSVSHSGREKKGRAYLADARRRQRAGRRRDEWRRRSPRRRRPERKTKGGERQREEKGRKGGRNRDEPEGEGLSPSRARASLPLQARVR